MIIGFPPVAKTSSDIITILCDWTPFVALTQGATSITAHSVVVDAQIDGAPGGFGEFDFLAIGTAGVTAVDNGVTGFVQSVTLSGGMLYAFSVVALTVTFSDGTQLTRCFQASVR